MEHLTLIVRKSTPPTVLADGICCDETVFTRASFKNADELVHYVMHVLSKKYNTVSATLWEER